MTKAVIRSEEFPEGYRITNTARGLIIEPIGSDQKPLELTRALIPVPMGFLVSAKK